MITKIRSALKNRKPFEEPNAIDVILAKSILRLIPESFTPNHVTIFRYVTIPFILYLLAFEHYIPALILFSVSSFSDVLDGAMARTRESITEWGKLNDPIADKLLIGGAGVFLVTKYIGLAMIVVIIAIELVIIIYALYKRSMGEKIASALLPGKIKMILQSVALILLLVYSVLPLPILIPLTEITLYFAILFALISLLIYKSI